LLTFGLNLPPHHGRQPIFLAAYTVSHIQGEVWISKGPPRQLTDDYEAHIRHLEEVVKLLLASVERYQPSSFAAITLPLALAAELVCVYLNSTYTPVKVARVSPPAHSFWYSIG